MSQWNNAMFLNIRTGMNKDAVNDLYRIQNNLPLEGEGPHRFLATKVPIRKNKDYRARLRNFVIGYPV